MLIKDAKGNGGSFHRAVYTVHFISLQRISPLFFCVQILIIVLASRLVVHARKFWQIGTTDAVAVNLANVRTNNFFLFLSFFHYYSLLADLIFHVRPNITLFVPSFNHSLDHSHTIPPRASYFPFI